MLMLCVTSCKDDDAAPVADGSPADIITLNVDVVLPASIQAQWKNVIDWAQENIAKAQQKQRRQVKLNLRYHDEDTEDLDDLGFRLTHPEKGDDTCHAIIGPYHSDHAMSLLAHARKTRLPVIMPTCSSAELQRINARNTYAWFLTESDITQCEVMLSAAHAMKATDVALIYSDDSYGHSFRDWFAFYASEQELHIAGGVQPYTKGQDLSAFLDETINQTTGHLLYVLVALSDASDYVDVCNQCARPYDAEHNVFTQTICASTSYDMDLLQTENFTSFYYGVTPMASMVYGFSQTYEGRFSHKPFAGEAQMYDALCLVALGAAHRAASPDQCLVNGKQVTYKHAPYEPGLTDYMRAVVSSNEGLTTQWDATGLYSAFCELAAGHSIDLTGASGSLWVDAETQTKVLNTTYMLWTVNLAVSEDLFVPYSIIRPIIYLSTAGTSGEASTTAMWLLEKDFAQSFDDEEIEYHELPDATDCWAVVISPSTTWENYRHQADAFAMYQLLRRHGYEDDHIVLIVEDNLADDKRNVFPGQIFVESAGTGGEDVRKDAKVDYHFSQLRPEDLADIMMGRQSERLPHVIHSDYSSNVFFFWSGHGGSKEGPLWGNEDSKEYFGTQRISDIVTEMAGTANSQSKKYRRMMFAIETCYSGKWGVFLEGQPDVLVITAANPFETSKADVYDDDLGVYLSNAFARTFRTYVDLLPEITVYDLYKELYKTTNGSHVTTYNQRQYGSVYQESMVDYFPE